jgi:hypothetical protein
MGFDHSYPYVLGANARAPEAAFIFAGVPAGEGAIIGDHGTPGDRVAGQERDNRPVPSSVPGT